MKQPTGTRNDTEPAVPRAFAYQRLADSPQAQAVRSKLERVARSPLDLPDETVRQFGVAMNTGDVLGDAYIDAAFATRPSKARARKDVEQALKGGIGSVADPAPELLALFEHINTEPGPRQGDESRKASKCRVRRVPRDRHVGPHRRDRRGRAMGSGRG